MTRGQVDARTVRRHLAALDVAVRQLRRHEGRPIEALRNDLDELWVVAHGLLLCTQNAVDVATHLVASQGRDAASYGDALEALGELGILPRDFAHRLRGMAGFRNVLVHGYLDLDVDVVHRVLNENLSDFVRFAELIERSLGS